MFALDPERLFGDHRKPPVEVETANQGAGKGAVAKRARSVPTIGRGNAQGVVGGEFHTIDARPTRQVARDLMRPRAQRDHTAGLRCAEHREVEMAHRVTVDQPALAASARHRELVERGDRHAQYDPDGPLRTTRRPGMRNRREAFASRKAAPARTDPDLGLVRAEEPAQIGGLGLRRQCALEFEHADEPPGPLSLAHNLIAHNRGGTCQFQGAGTRRPDQKHHPEPGTRPLPRSQHAVPLAPGGGNPDSIGELIGCQNAGLYPRSRLDPRRPTGGRTARGVTAKATKGPEITREVDFSLLAVQPKLG